MARGRFRSWSAMIVGWACWCAAGVVGAQTATQSAPSVRRLTGPEISFVVPQSATGPFEFEATVEVDDKLRAAFGADNPIGWRPNVQQSVLKRSLPFALGDDTAPPLVMTLANAPAAAGSPPPAVVLHAERGLLLEPRRLKIVLPKPRQIAAGVYRGEVVSRMKTLGSDIEIDYVWPLVLRVEGRHLSGLRFRGRGDGATQPASLPIGAPASLVVDLITVGEDVELGAGVVRMTSRRGAAASEVAEVLRLPLAAQMPPIDASVDLPLMRPWNDVRPFCTPNWSNQVLYVEAKKAATETVEGTRLTLHRIHVHLSSAFELGRWTADVDWDACQGAHAEVDVVPGIRVFPELALVGEKVRVQVVCESSDASEIELTLIHSSGAAVPFKAARSSNSVGSSAEKNAEFTATIAAGSFGAYTIAPSKTPENEALAKPPAPGGFEVFFRHEHKLSAPFKIYTDSPLPWETDPTLCHDLKIERRRALHVEHSSQAVLEGLVAELKAVSRRGKSKAESTRFRSASDWQRAPRMSFSSDKQGAASGDGFEPLAVYSASNSRGDDASAQGAHAQDAPAQDPPSSDDRAASGTSATLARWSASPASPTSVGFDMRLEIDDSAKHEEHDLEMRFVIGGVGTDGRARYRTLVVPFKAIVTSQWLYFQQFIWGAVVTLAIGMLVAVIIYYFKRRLAPPKVAPMLESSPIVDLSDGGVRPMTRLPERAPKANESSGSRDGESAPSAADESDPWSAPAGFGESTGLLRPDDSSGEDSSMLRP